MDLMEEGNVSCGVKNCSTPGFQGNCSNQDLCVTVIVVPLIIFGLLGNTLTLLVVWLRPNMRSSAHLYLSSMAVSDLLILLLLALGLLQVWTQKLGVFGFKLTMFLSECCTFCTILHITFLSLERYLVVCWPITSKTLVTRRRTRALIGCLWLGAAVSAAPFLVMMNSFSSGLELAMIILTNLYVVVPMCILGLVYILIGRTLRLRPQRSRKDKSHRHAVKMLGVIFLAFVLCWLPYIVCLTKSYVSQRSGLNSTDFSFILVSWILSRLSAAINPLVYNLMSARYRHAVRSLVHTHCLTPSHRLSTTLSSGHSTTTL
ncbi:growth hormone secretagogue receptor type 1-like [Hippoglossus stenolepis]|uniref:growth hormone secretagogue receptor type 1-like n=1 Tax=Hippoglossus stenolepis TaxID=195615 RepID=UPI001FAF84F6|nr:growth hormone secretagogue receptor type 1-like [Hippoglossus stenolepis]